MNLVYTIHGTYNSGGMERVLANKVNYFASLGHQVTIITSDQKGRPHFFDLHPAVNHIDLDINYCDIQHYSLIKRRLKLHNIRIKHRKALADMLMELRADIVVSMYSGDQSMLPYINDGSKKVLEIHFSRFYYQQMNSISGRKNPIYKLVQLYRSWSDIKHIAKFDCFVVLTNEDKAYWSSRLKNISVIHNGTQFAPNKVADSSSKRVIAVGRHNPQKGFDYLINSWSIIIKEHPDWRLSIVGGGELLDKHRALAKELNIDNSIDFYQPTSDVESLYLSGSIYAMSSRFEGLPMVLIEAMSCGLPCVSYACLCGPRDVIDDGIDGYIVDKVGDVQSLAEKLIKLMSDDELRQEMSINAKRKSEEFTLDKIMIQWSELFDKLMNTTTI